MLLNRAESHLSGAPIKMRDIIFYERNRRVTAEVYSEAASTQAPLRAKQWRVSCTTPAVHRGFRSNWFTYWRRCWSSAKRIETRATPMRKLIPSSDRACYLQFTGMSQVNENAARRFKYSRRAYRDPSFNVQDRIVRRYITTPIRKLEHLSAAPFMPINWIVIDGRMLFYKNGGRHPFLC